MSGLITAPTVQANGIAEPNFGVTDFDNAARLVYQAGQNIKYTLERGWLIFDGWRWVVDEGNVLVNEFGKRVINSITEEALKKQDLNLARHGERSKTQRSLHRMIELAKTAPELHAKIRDFDADVYAFNVQNGTIDLRTGRISEYARDDKITKLADVFHDQDADCPWWDVFLKEIFAGDKEKIAFIQRVAGYSLTGEVSEQSLPLLLGMDANCKAIFFAVLRRLFGEYATVLSADFDYRKRSTKGSASELARLNGARIAFIEDVSEGEQLDEAFIEKMSGSGTIQGQFPGFSSFDFRSSHKLIISANQLPFRQGHDAGFWRRVYLVPFEHPGSGFHIDRSFGDKLIGELPGILNWAVRGCLEWQTQGLSAPNAIVDATREFREGCDPLNQFIDSHCDLGVDFTCAASDFFIAYRTFAKLFGVGHVTMPSVKNEMKRRRFRAGRASKGNLYFGIRLKSQLRSNETNAQDF